MHRAALFNSTNHWFRDALQAADVTGKSIARQLHVDPSQVSRWVNGTEKLPRMHLLEIADILRPSDIEYVQNLKHCEEVEEHLQKAVATLLEEEPSQIQYLLDQLFAKLRSAISEELQSSPREHALIGARFLVAAVFAVRCALSARYSPDEQLVSTQNISRHLRYPNNHFIGLLLELARNPSCPKGVRRILSDFREAALSSLRITSSATPRRKNAASAFVTQHSLHMLARHGDIRDQHMVRQLLTGARQDANPMARRLAFAGISLSEKDPDISQRFLREVQSSEAMRITNIEFDAIHYGDLDLAQHMEPSSGDRPYQTVKHVVRHIVSVDHYRSIHSVEEQTLADIYSLYGKEVFNQEAVVDRLCICLSSRTSTQLSDQFLSTAQSILCDLREAPTQHPSTKP